MGGHKIEDRRLQIIKKLGRQSGTIKRGIKYMLISKTKSSSKYNFYDYLYLFLMMFLLFDRYSILPEGSVVNLFIYQFLICLISLLSIATFKKIFMPDKVIIIYFSVFIQSAVLILIGRVEFNIILKECIQLILLILLAINIYNYFMRERDKLIKFINIAFYFWIFSALFFMISFYLFDTKMGVFLDVYFPYPRATGLNVDPNVLGIYILTFLPFVLYFNRKKSSKKVKALVLSFIVIALTFSRSNIVLFVVFLVFYCVTGLISKKVSKKEACTVFFILAILFLIVFLIPSVREVILLRIQQFNQENTINSDSRFGIWVRALEVIKQYPVLGVGLDHSKFYLYKYVHNTFIEWILSVGVFLGIVIIIFYLRNLFKHLRKIKQSEFDFYMFIAYLNHIITLNFVSLLSFEPTFILFAITAAHLKNVKNKTKEI